MGVTIKDVAKAAGVSISTVSKVINGHYSISEETQERVRQVIRRQRPELCERGHPNCHCPH